MTNVSDAADKIKEAAQSMVVQDQRIADSSRDALKANNEQSRNTLNATIMEYRLEHRAWMSMNEILIIRTEADGTQHGIQVGQVRPGDRIFLNVPYKNTGSTPAFDAN